MERGPAQQITLKFEEGTRCKVDRMLCRTVKEQFPDFTGIAVYLSRGGINNLPSGLSFDDVGRKINLSDYTEILRRTRLFRLFVLSVGGLLMLGLSVKYALRQWTKYLAHRKKSPAQVRAEKRIVQQRNPRRAAKWIQQ